jgi:Family of unknown function (DUF6496)
MDSFRKLTASSVLRRNYRPVISNVGAGKYRALSGKSAVNARRLEMPEKEVIERARRDAREGKSPSTQAGEFVGEEMDHIREGKHGARSPQQAIAIGLSKARRAGVNLPPPKNGKASSRFREQARRDIQRGRMSPQAKPSARRSRAVSAALRREGHSAASRASLARQAHSAAQKRGSRSRRRAAPKAVKTKGSRGLWRAAHQGARARWP